jgi:hypothetical protein
MRSDVWIADEFGAVLDRVTAKAVAFSMQKVARALGKTFIVATTHTDLGEELGPSLTITKRFREKIMIEKLVDRSCPYKTQPGDEFLDTKTLADCKIRFAGNLPPFPGEGPKIPK